MRRITILLWACLLWHQDRIEIIRLDRSEYRPTVVCCGGMYVHYT